MDVNKAAKSLEEKFRDRPWFLMVGTGEADGRLSLFLYVKSTRDVPPTLLREGWEGFPVVVRKIGVPRPAFGADLGRRPSESA